MTTGTEGNDNLTNDDNQEYETIDALGGDDRITLSNSGVHEHIFVTVNGGAGTDTISITARSANSSTAGSIDVKVSDFRDFSVTHNSVERLEIDVQFVGLLVTGNSDDRIHVRAGTAP
ncbi:MAG: hypothetical protein ACK40O_12440, partial [Allosphingosinicella sp.]